MNKRKLCLCFIFCILFLLLLPVTASADFGPKDSLTVFVVNYPSEPYYLDLLTKNSSTYNNFHDEGERESLNQEMVELLYSYKDEGWMPALTEGTGVPMWGNLTGEQKGKRMVHEFGYFGLPDTYRIIIVTESGKVSVSGEYTRKALQSSITYDYLAKTASVPPIIYTYLIQFLVTFTLTLLLEGIILLLFRINLKENWKVFLAVNFITQIILTFTVGIALIKSGTLAAYIIFIPMEILIIAIETLAYRFFLVGTGNKRKILYGIAANSASWIAGFFLLNYLFLLLNMML